jgi:RNA polymerase sigma-70 factor (ECF subfamily)
MTTESSCSTGFELTVVVVANDACRLKKTAVVADHPSVAGARLAELELLYRAKFPTFLRVATAIVRDEEVALDAVQDAFASAIRSRRQFRGEAPLEAWVWRMVVNAARKARRPLAEVVVEAAVNGASPAESGDLRAAIEALPDRQRTVLFLRYFADLDYHAIAAALDVTPGTVGSTLNAAHAALRRSLKEVPR